MIRELGRAARALLLTAAVGSLGARDLTAQRARPDWRAFDRYVEGAARDWGAAGLAIAVVHGDSTVFAKGYGLIEVGKSAPVTEHTRFAIGSTTKAMTTVALGMLVDEGKLKWDDRVIDHLPELQLYDPFVTRELTVRDLLTHRSGLPNTDVLWALPENELTMPETIRRLRYVRPNSSFRSTWTYQNVMYAVAGYLVDRVSGQPWDAFVRTRIFAPLGMRESEPLVAQVVGKAQVAVPHRSRNGTLVPTDYRSTDAVAPAGSVYSSVADMTHWLRFVLDSGRVGTQRLLTPATFREMVAPQIRVPAEQYPALALSRPTHFSYGLGWFVQDYRGETVWMHTGSINGMSAIVGLLPERRVGMVVLANLDHIELRHALMYQAFDLFLSGRGRDWSRDLKSHFDQSAARATQAAAPSAAPGTASAPSLPLAQYAGTFADSAFGTVEVRLDAGALQLRYGRAQLGALKHVQHEIFESVPARAGANPTRVTFIPDGAGGVSAIRAFGVTFPRSRGARQ